MKIDIRNVKGYMQDLERDSAWLTEYAQDKADCQRLIDMTITMNRARWLIAELIGDSWEYKGADVGWVKVTTEPQTDCSWK